MNEFLELRNVVKSFDEHTVLKDISLSVRKGEFIVFLGPSGCGKTTLLRCIAGLEQVNSGSIFLDGNDITYASPQERDMGMIFQQSALFPTMTVFKNIAYGLKLKKLSKAEIDRKVGEALEIVEMTGHANKYPSQLSGGEQQRIALARNLVLNPKVLLLDEPFSAIDAKLRKSLQVQVRELHKEFHMTSIFVTHDQEEAMRMADRIFVMYDGKIEQSGPPEEIYAMPATPFVASFIGHYNIMDGAQLYRMAGGRATYHGLCAIRPECIRLATQVKETTGENEVIMEGVIQRFIIQGNIIRYTVKVGECEIDVDVLFQKENTFSVDDRVWLSVDKDKIITYT